MYKLKINGFEYIPAICPRCGSHDITAKGKKAKLECRRGGYIGRWKEFFVGPEREKVQKLFMGQILKGTAPIGSGNK